VLQHQISKPGEFNFASLTVMRGGLVEFQKIDKPVVIDAGLVKVQYQGKMFVYHSFIRSGHGVVESEGKAGAESLYLQLFLIGIHSD